MKILIACYSRTGMTKKVAEALAQKLNAELEEIKDTADRSGARGYLLSGRDAMKKRLTKLEPVRFNPAEYDMTIIGTPIWAWNVSAPVRTYITENKDKFQNTAFFCTMGGSGDKKTFIEMEKVIGKKPERTLSLTTKEVVNNKFSEKLNKFLSGIYL